MTSLSDPDTVTVLLAVVAVILGATTSSVTANAASFFVKGNEMKYRKKPIVIEAYQLTEDCAKGNACLHWPDTFIWDAHDKGALPPPETGEIVVYVEGANVGHEKVVGAVIGTLEGVLHASVDDWIIVGIQGEKYPCKPDIFEATYEVVE